MLKYSLAALALIATPALAQEDTAKPLGGAYAGVIAGYDHVTLSGFGGSGSKDGVSYGALLGYDMRMGAGLVGVEAEIAGSSTKETATNISVVGDSGAVKAGRDFYVGVRGGMLATPTTLLYVKGGYANGRINIDYTSPTPANSFSIGSSVGGFRVGAGVEQGFGPFRVRLEYRYTDYGQFKYSGVNTGIDAKRHQVLIGLLGSF